MRRRGDSRNIGKGELLKESKKPINLEIDDKTELSINYKENDLKGEDYK